MDFYDSCVMDTLVPIKPLKPEVIYFFIDREYHLRFDDPLHQTDHCWTGFVKQVLNVEMLPSRMLAEADYAQRIIKMINV